MKGKQIKISVIEPVGGHGGMDYYDFGLCHALAEAGADVVLHTCDKTSIPSEAPYTVRQSYVGIYGDSPSWLRGLRYLRGSFSALWSALLERRRICHFHFFHVGPLEFFNFVLARLLFRQIVITAHDVESFVEGLDMPCISRWIYRNADRVIAHNGVSKQELIKKIHVHEGSIALIPLGNYLHALRPLPNQNEARRSLGIRKGAKVLLFFGQIKEVKGLDLLLRAIPKVLEKHPDTVLLIAGRPWKCDFSNYDGIMKRLGIVEHCITHLKYISDDELPKYFAACDVVVLPYRRIYQSGVVLMAMSYGKLVLASDLPGMMEVVQDGETGLLFQQGEVGSLVEKIHVALSDPVLRENLASSGFEHVCDAYDWGVIGAQIHQLYSSLDG